MHIVLDTVTVLQYVHPKINQYQSLLMILRLQANLVGGLNPSEKY